jgi:hypothetical protein
MVFWDVTSSCLADRYGCFGGTCCLNVQGWYSVISQKNIIFIFTMVRTSNLTLEISLPSSYETNAQKGSATFVSFKISF